MVRNRNNSELKVSKKYVDFENALRHFRLATFGNLVRYGLTPLQRAEFGSAHFYFLTAFAKYSNPDTRTDAVILEIEERYKTARKVLNKLQQQIKNDKSIEPLTSAERADLSIHTDKETRTRAEVPTDTPQIVEIGRNLRSTKFQAKNRPYKARLLVKVAYPAAGTEPQETDYQIAAETGQANFTIEAPPEIANGTVGYLKGFYLNTRGNGPESRPIQFVVN